MKFYCRLLLPALLFAGFQFNLKAQVSSCFEIESILVDACAPRILFTDQEGKNEMIRFRVGASPLNTADLSVSWAGPGMNWLGLRGPDATTAQKTAQLNATIQSCGRLLEPVNGVLPANSLVLLITSHEVSASYNSFSQLLDTLYVIYQNNTNVVSGHFRNSSPNVQTTRLSFGSGCQDEVTYYASQLINTWGGTGSADGATVLFTPDGVPTYINNGCVAPVPVVSAQWQQLASVSDNNGPVNLTGRITGTPGGVWSGTGVSAEGVFDPTGLCGQTISITYTVTLDLCSQIISDAQTWNVSVGYSANASWAPPASVCATATPINLASLVTGTAGGVWSGQGVSGSTFDPEGLSGNVALTYTAGDSPCERQQTHTIQVLDTPDASWVSPNGLCQQTEPLDLDILVTGTPGGVWSGEGVSGSFFDPVGLAGLIDITYTHPGSCGSSMTHTVNVSGLPELVLSGRTEYCIGDAAEMLDSDPVQGGMVQWYGDSALTELLFTGDSFAPPVEESATYYAIQMADGCISFPASIGILVNETPATPYGSPVIDLCPGDRDTVLSVEGPGIITWYADEQLNDTISIGNTYALEADVADLWVIAGNGACRSDIFHITVADHEPVSATIHVSGSTVLCGDAPVELSSSSPVNNEWTGGSSAQTLVAADPGTYKLTVTGFCNTATDSVVLIEGTTVAGFSVSPDNGPAPLEVSITDQSINAAEQVWSLNGEPFILNPDNHRIVLEEEGEYLLVQLVTSDAGCTDQAEHTVVVINHALVLSIPNSFTPNGDGYNDLLQVKHNQIKDFKALIFNRWGQEVYNWNDPSMGWDGTAKGNPVPDGVYFYVIKAVDSLTNTPLERKGDITIKRK